MAVEGLELEPELVEARRLVRLVVDRRKTEWEAAKAAEAPNGRG